ncbi:MAG: efflux RND transporter periplasmic adaptor subunit [Comamonadaceae bacterium]
MKSVKYLKLSSSLLLLLAALPYLSACSRTVPPPDPVQAVKVLMVAAQSMQSGSEFAGEVRARIESRVGFRVAGKLIRRAVDVGQRVKAGQLLAQLDAQDYQLATDAARAQLAAAVTSRDLAAADFRRFKELRDQNFISGAELERREATLKATQAQLEQAQAQLTGQGNQAAYTTLQADVSGVVTAVEAEPGQVLAAGTPVLRIAQDGPRDVVFAVPEDKIGLITLGMGVEVRVWPSNASVQARVRELAASADPVTRTFAVKVSLAAKDVLPLGSTVTVVPKVFDRSGIDVIKLPTSALYQSGKSAAVWLLDPASMTIRLQPVQIATADGNDLVVASGLQPGMLVVSAGVHVLSAGQKVSIYKGNSPVPSSLAAQRTANSAASDSKTGVAPSK